jgi:hypothetical protein
VLSGSMAAYNQGLFNRLLETSFSCFFPSISSYRSGFSGDKLKKKRKKAFDFIIRLTHKVS